MDWLSSQQNIHVHFIFDRKALSGHRSPMSVDEAAAAVLSQIALAADGAVLGLVLAYVAVRSVLNYSSSSSALTKIKHAPSLRVSDLRSILSSSDHDSGDKKLVVVRGYVEAKAAVEGNWKSLRPNHALVSPQSGEKAVVLLRTQTVRAFCFN